MEQNLTAAKAVMVAAWGAISAFLGWKGVLAMAWILVMLLDYMSGTAAAMKNGDWNSARAREGLWHKCGMVFSVLVAAIADGVFAVALGNIPQIGAEWPGLLLPLVLTWYILTELGSILENAVALGANVPAVLTKLLKASIKKVEDAVPEVTEPIEEKTPEAFEKHENETD